ncbi:hypothetical protein ACFE04_021446 [Oxalis oulophora]
MFRSKRIRDKHSQLPADDVDPIRLSVRQRLGLRPPIQPRANEAHQFRMQPHENESNLPFMQPFSVQPPFIRLPTSQTPSVQPGVRPPDLRPPTSQPPDFPTTLFHPSTSQSSVMQQTRGHSFSGESSTRQSLASQSNNDDTFSDDETDEEEAKLLKQVEIVDRAGVVLRNQEMSAKDVYKKVMTSERILVHVNDHSQTIGAAGGVCTRFMSSVIAQPNICPLDAKNWPEAKQIAGVRLLGELRYNRNKVIVRGICAAIITYKGLPGFGCSYVMGFMLV